jgi:Mn2+/Fe2+ NRAMP family transporter
MVRLACIARQKANPIRGEHMTSTPDFKKINKTMKIFAVVQFGLLALLIYMAVNFQGKLRMLGRERNFMQGVIASFIIQLILFYPIYKFAAKEADRDLTLTGAPLTKEQLKEFSKKKRFADIIKMSTFGFYVIFMLAAPADPLVLSVIYYSFVLTILTYLQCYNFAAKKLMKDRSTP